MTVDPDIERNVRRTVGIEAMRRTAVWLKEQGATVELSIEDPNLGHGALVLNPANAKRLLDLFLAGKK